MSEAKKREILIVDDDKMIIQALTEILHPEYKVFVVKNGHEAIQKAKRLLPDIILLDIVMPELDGFDVLNVLKNTEKTVDIPVIFITGVDTLDSEKKALKMGAVDYITKPLKSDIVKLRIQNQIRILERYEIEHDLNIVLKLQDELNIAKESAEHASRAKSEFLSRMSHEMLTPLNTITGMVSLAKRAPEKAAEFLEEIENASRDLLKITTDVLDISGMEYGIFKLDEAEFSLRVVLDAVMDEAIRYSKAKQQKVAFSIDRSIPEGLIGDEKRLSQVITCLFSNAIKFSPEHGEINLDANVTDDDDGFVTIQVEVTDNGKGIPADEREGLFTIFEQVDGSNTREHGGIGLGLPLSKRIVEMMDGDIWVESEPGKGAKFIFTCKLRKVG